MYCEHVQLRWVDETHGGYLTVTINGQKYPCLQTGFDIGNDANFISSLQRLIYSVYESGHVAGEQVGKKKITDLLKWADS